MINVSIYCNEQLQPKHREHSTQLFFFPTSIAASKVVAENWHKFWMHYIWKNWFFFSAFHAWTVLVKPSQLAGKISNIIFFLLQSLISSILFIHKIRTCHHSDNVFSSPHSLKHSSQEALENTENSLQNPLWPPSSNESSKSQESTHTVGEIKWSPWQQSTFLLLWEGRKVSAFTWCWCFY